MGDRRLMGALLAAQEAWWTGWARLSVEQRRSAVALQLVTVFAGLDDEGDNARRAGWMRGVCEALLTLDLE